MKDAYLLTSSSAMRLYEVARALPIIDFHNHLCVADLAADRKYADLCELWLTPDPYKHRLMRISGIEEHYITGDAEPFEKFERFCAIFPSLVGTPVYDWARMELSEVFGIDLLPTRETARRIYDEANERLSSSEYSTRALLSRFHIEYQSPVATLTDDLSLFDGVSVCPSLRADDLLSPTSDLYARLSSRTGIDVRDEDSYLCAISRLLDRFDACGCRFADHALDAHFFADDTDGTHTRLLSRLGTEYAKRGWTLLLHMNAQRKTSTRLAALAGPAGGYAAAGECLPIPPLTALLDRMESGGGLPDTVLFTLNTGDIAPLAILQGSYSEDGVASKVQLGPAWWWCDHALGIEQTLTAIASFGVLSRFIGMTTDSRSILSFVRHDYFRRILCSYLARENERLGWGQSDGMLGETVRAICYQNAKNKLERK